MNYTDENKLANGKVFISQLIFRFFVKCAKVSTTDDFVTTASHDYIVLLLQNVDKLSDVLTPGYFNFELYR